MKRRTPLLLLSLVTCTALSLACAVPISSESQTATAVAAGEQPPTSGGGSESSLRADNPSLGLNIVTSGGVDAKQSPVATRGPLSAATSAVEDASVAIESPTPSVTATPSRTPTPTNTLAPGETPRPTPTITPTPTTAPQPSANLVGEALDLINNQRVARGLQALVVNPALAATASDYAKYMGVNNFFGHYAPDGSSPQSRLTAAGYKGHYRGEALSAGQSTASQAIAALLASPAHSAILLDESASEVGIGYYYQPGSTYLYYWVVATGAQ